MEIKSLFDPIVKKETIDRIEKLSSDTVPHWGKMNAGQMLAHLQIPMGVALGIRTVRANWMLRLIMPLFKKALYDKRPWKRGLPTDRTFVTIGQEKDFQTEKARVLELVGRFTQDQIVADRHPIFGHLTHEQWSMATWKHFNHHLRQFGV